MTEKYTAPVGNVWWEVRINETGRLEYIFAHTAYEAAKVIGRSLAEVRCRELEEKEAHLLGLIKKRKMKYVKPSEKKSLSSATTTSQELESLDLEKDVQRVELQGLQEKSNSELVTVVLTSLYLLVTRQALDELYSVKSKLGQLYLEQIKTDLRNWSNSLDLLTKFGESLKTQLSLSEESESE